MEYFSSSNRKTVYQTLANYVNPPIRPANTIRTTGNVIILVGESARGAASWNYESTEHEAKEKTGERAGAKGKCISVGNLRQYRPVV